MLVQPKMMISRSVLIVVCAWSLMSRIAVSINVASSCQPPTTIGFHTAVCTPDGNLALPLAFASLEDSLLKAVSWYLTSPLDEHGFPPVVRLQSAFKARIYVLLQRGSGCLHNHAAGALDIRRRQFQEQRVDDRRRYAGRSWPAVLHQALHPHQLLSPPQLCPTFRHIPHPSAARCPPRAFEFLHSRRNCVLPSLHPPPCRRR
jgi:hypothetical protein